MSIPWYLFPGIDIPELSKCFGCLFFTYEQCRVWTVHVGPRSRFASISRQFFYTYSCIYIYICIFICTCIYVKCASNSESIFVDIWGLSTHTYWWMYIQYTDIFNTFSYMYSTHIHVQYIFIHTYSINIHIHWYIYIQYTNILNTFSYIYSTHICSIHIYKYIFNIYSYI